MANPANRTTTITSPPFPTTTPSLPTQLKPFLTLITTTNLPSTLPICLTCHIAVLPQNLPSHFRKQHPLPPAPALRPSLHSLASTLPALHFSSVPKPPDGSPPIPALKVVHAFQCRQCPFIRRDVTDVRKHVNRAHGVSALGNYGAVRAQSWFGGRWAAYWRVGSEWVGGGGEGGGGEGEEAEAELKMGGDGEEEEKGEGGAMEREASRIEGMGNAGERSAMERRKDNADGKERDRDEIQQGSNSACDNKTPPSTGLVRAPDGSSASICVWGFYGNGWGHRQPTPWKK